jgi:hypothetical protein
MQTKKPATQAAGDVNLNQVNNCIPRRLDTAKAGTAQAL